MGENFFNYINKKTEEKLVFNPFYTSCKNTIGIVKGIIELRAESDNRKMRFFCGFMTNLSTLQ